MNLRKFTLLFAISTFALAGAAESVTGTILVKRRLSKRSVTAAVSVYQRGTEVKLAKAADEDPIAYERSRVVIYLESTDAPANASGDAPAAQMAQLDREFSPNLVVVPVGSTVSFPNMDPIFHNVFSLSKPKSFDLGDYDKGETRTVTFPKPGIVEIYCRLHPNMAATIVVTPNRWYARPDATGAYRIPDVPPGHYTVVAWHKTAGFFRKSIDVEAGHNSAADFFIPLEEETKLAEVTK